LSLQTMPNPDPVIALDFDGSSRLVVRLPFLVEGSLT